MADEPTTRTADADLQETATLGALSAPVAPIDPPPTAASSPAAPMLGSRDPAPMDTPAASFAVAPATRTAVAPVDKDGKDKDGGKDKDAPARSIPEIQADIAETRDRLARTLADLKVEANPKHIAAKKTEQLKGFFLDEYGGVRPDRVLMVAGGVVGLLVLRRIVRRRHRS